MFKEKIKKYYDLVDSNEFEKLFSLFSSKIIYFRCEQKIEGIENVKGFYLNERKIKGEHKINKIIQSEKTIFVLGVFSGKNSLGKKIKLDFVDLFEFDNTGKIIERKTYLATGYDQRI